MSMKLGVVYNAYPADVGGIAGFLQEAAERNYRSLIHKSWPVDEGFDPIGLEVDEVASYADERHRRVVFRLDEALAFVAPRNGYAESTVAGDTAEQARALMARLEELIPKETRQDESFAITFWAYSPNGPTSVRRRLEAPGWDDIAENYCAETREEVEELLRRWMPGRGGQLVLWSGVPGTGKTTAIRALAREWSDWAEFHYVTDPDKFFGEHSDYMMSVLLGEDSDKWRILLLEDAGELLAADARIKTGQGLSRFLNAVDGLIGQGLNLLVLVTTNEELKKLNPAVARPGRCASQIEFGELSAEEVAAWLAGKGIEDAGARGLGGRSTIAELYAIVEGFSGKPLLRSVGFGA